MEQKYQQREQRSGEQGNDTCGQSSQVLMLSTGTSNHLDEMLKRQASNFRAFQRTISGINLDLINEQWELKDALRILQSRWATIDSLHIEIDSELEGSDESYDRSFTKYESIFNDLRKQINSKLWSESHREQATPRLDIPFYSGNYQQWVSFKDLFTEAIHTNRALSSAQKMQYLKGKLRGEAERLVQHLSISSENYNVCWEILNHRYNNVRLIFTSHVNTIMNMPAVQQVSANHIKRVHDTTLECLHAIKNLGVDISSWDPLIVHILLQKIDVETHNHYLESLKNPRDLPKLKDFMQFLESKFTSLESSRKRSPDQIRQPSTSHNIPTYQRQNKSSNYNANFKNSIPHNKVALPQSFDSKSAKSVCPLCNDLHGLFYCTKFLSMTPHQKRNAVTKLHLCQNCLYDHKNKACFSEKRCRICSDNHNTILHEAFIKQSHNDAYNGESSRMIRTAVEPQNRPQQPSCNYTLQQNNVESEVLLSTAIIQVQSSNGTYHKLRALIDQGAQSYLITERAAQLLELPRSWCKGIISGVGEKGSSCKGMSNISCMSSDGQYSFSTEVVILNTITKNLPRFSFLKPAWKHIEDLNLADPEFNISRSIDVLLGAKIYSNIVMNGLRRANDKIPVAQESKLGWLLIGDVEGATTLHCHIVINEVDEIKKFWQLEEIAESSSLSDEDQKCLQYYESTTKRRNDGSYEVRIPFKEDFEKELGESKHMAVAQFYQLERKFRNNAGLAQNYKSFMHEYIAMGHMTPSPTSPGTEKHNCYLPHHLVLRNDSSTTALRVVFDGSRKTKSAKSINDLMLKGPNLQQDIQILILKFRQHKYAFTADIEKMFRFIWVNAEDQVYQKIVWRDQPTAELQDYRLCTISYGTKAAPFLAMMTLKRLAQDERLNFKNSQAIEVLEQNFYTDDVLHGSHSLREAIKLKQDLIKLLKSGGFNLRKWASNAKELLGDDIKQNSFDFKHMESSKTLGLRWNPATDIFTFQPKLESTSKGPCTKRTLLSELSKLFDPLGWITPLSTKLKLLFQQVWTLDLKWDDELPIDFTKEWANIKQDLSQIDQFQVKRWLNTLECDDLELHGFSDASNKAYACVIYCKIKRNQEVSTILVAGKAKLVPIKSNASIPRLELCGALLLSKLMKKVQESLVHHKITTYGWIDSMAVLGWLNGEPKRWQPFVANRVRQITEIMPAGNWRYVKSAENPADCASRGMSGKQLKEHTLWWEGPTWLLAENSYSKENEQTYFTNKEVKKQSYQVYYVAKQEDNILNQLLARYSSFTKLIRILAWMQRFIKQVREKQIHKKHKYLSLQEIKQAKHIIIRHIQHCEFKDEINNLKQSKQISTKSKTLELNPFLNEYGLLRVGGRLRNANIDPEMMHPIIIPHSGLLTDLIIDHAHKVTFHGGARVTAASIRQKFWIIGGNRAVKKRVRRCVTCRKHSTTKQSQLMGDYPTARCNPCNKIFEHTGVDFTGHVTIKTNKGRGVKTTKGYVAVFVCMATKLVHLELVSDLTSSAFIAALRRMSARRGCPRHIYSDNGTNFVGASKILEQEFEHLQQIFGDEFLTEITSMNIEWHFNAPSWPSAGGLWERAVRSLKYHMKRVIGDQRLTYEEFTTILAQLEAVLNSRPLCPLTEDPDDLEFLTLSSFINVSSTLNILETESDMRTRWYLTQKIVQDIWQRWRTEYLSALTARSKWKTEKSNIKINDIVTINDTNLPAGKWAMGRVVELHPGNDGLVRVVTLKTKNGYIKRPIIKISPLPVNKEIEEESLEETSVPILRSASP